MEKISASVIEEAAYQLLANTGTKYPKNYLEKLVAHFKKETNSGAKSVLASILQNIIYAVEESASLCQDSGVPAFHVYLNPAVSIEGDIEKALTEDLPPCHADPHLIEQVILNLINNAAEAMKNVDGDKKIGVRSSVENNRIIVKISDSGTGVSLDSKGKIFDPFYTTKNGSTGIGLSIVHRIVTDHGGTLGVATSKWGGAEFAIEIPIEEGKGQA
jgi:signal transduction histidine kinase